MTEAQALAKWIFEQYGIGALGKARRFASEKRTDVNGPSILFVDEQDGPGRNGFIYDRTGKPDELKQAVNNLAAMPAFNRDVIDEKFMMFVATLHSENPLMTLDEVFERWQAKFADKKA
jgi:hypothetical protein